MGESVETLRARSWFATMCLCLAAITGTITMAPPDLAAGIEPSRSSDMTNSRMADLDRIQRVLEQNMLRQRLQDYGVSPEEAMAKVRRLDDKELHLLATKMEGIPEGSMSIDLDTGDAILFVLAVLAIAVVIAFLIKAAMAAVSDIRNKPQPEPEPISTPTR